MMLLRLPRETKLSSKGKPQYFCAFKSTCTDNRHRQQKLEQLEKELGSAREQITEASATMAQRVSELSELRSENARLQAVLAEPQDKPDAGEAAAVGELRERIEGVFDGLCR